ncbi:MAG TPA: enoyl-CoA hydratase [Alphaproteobacteria bacterium]|nr:enoyl-CoA hydratase [Alphaproteobacteria bacterium]
MRYENIAVDTRGKVGVITLKRPPVNALNSALIAELDQALDAFEDDHGIGAIVLTGSGKAFSGGADIKEMVQKDYADAYHGDFIGPWERISRVRKPIIAAVNGFAFGGGCEIAMMCDFILAAEGATFGQPEITIGTIPGAGGTQRLTRAVGKSKAMEMILSGRPMDAAEAERAGLVSRILPADQLLEEALKVAAGLAELSLPALMKAKAAVNRAFETTLAEGVRFERETFYATFAHEDRTEGMRAFIEKRKPAYKNR